MSRYEYKGFHAILTAGWTGKTYYANTTDKGQNTTSVPFPHMRDEFGDGSNITDIGTFVDAARQINIEIPPNVVMQLINDRFRPGETNPFEVELQGWVCVEVEPSPIEYLRFKCPQGHATLRLDTQTEYPFICDDCDANYFLFEVAAKWPVPEDSGLMKKPGIEMLKKVAEGNLIDGLRDKKPKPQQRYEYYGWIISVIVDGDGHLGVYVSHASGSPVHDVGEDLGTDKEYGVRFTTDAIEDAYGKEQGL